MGPVQSFIVKTVKFVGKVIRKVGEFVHEYIICPLFCQCYRHAKGYEYSVQGQQDEGARQYRKRQQRLQEEKEEEAARQERNRQQRLQEQREEEARQERKRQQRLQEEREEAARKQRKMEEQIKRDEAARQQRQMQQQIEYEREVVDREKKKMEQYFADKREYEAREKRKWEQHIQDEREETARQDKKRELEIQYQNEEAARQKRKMELEMEQQKEEVTRLKRKMESEIQYEREEVAKQKKKMEQDIKDKLDQEAREKRIREERIQDEKEREDNKKKAVQVIQQQTEELADTLESCQQIVKEEFKNVSDKFQGMANSLDQAKNSMTPEQTIIVEKTKADFEKYPQIQNDISASIAELKKGFNPDKAEEFLKTVNKIEEKMNTLSIFVDELEKLVQQFNELYKSTRDESFDKIKKQIEIGKQAIIDKFGIRENRYRALKESLTKNSKINLSRLMNKVTALSLSPMGRRSIEELEEKWEDSTQDSDDQSRFFSELEQLVEEKYVSKKNLDKMLSRLN